MLLKHLRRSLTQKRRLASKSTEKRTWRLRVTWLKVDTKVKSSQLEAIFSTAKISGRCSKEGACAFSMYNTDSVHKAPGVGRRNFRLLR
jgi:hypothetical protein